MDFPPSGYYPSAPTVLLLAAKAQQRFNVTGDFWGGFDQKEKSWAPTWKKARSHTGFQTTVAWSGKV